MKELNEILSTFTEQFNDKLDEKLREACIAWGVDLNNHEEINKRCTLITQEDNKFKSLKIDGYLVMMFSDWESDDSLQYNSLYDNLKMSASFKCSEIVTPKDYNL